MTQRTDTLLLVNAMTGQFISGVATRIFIVSLPTVAAALDADILAVSWALIAYQLAGICLSVVFGRLGDIHGRYAIYGGGFVVMTLSSVLCGLAPTVGWLIAFRLVQGVGAAMIASATRVLAMEAMPEGAEGRANGFMTMSYHGGLLLGPPLGGLVIDWLSWRWIFFLLVPIGVAGTILTVIRARRRRGTPVEQAPAVDYVGAALLVVLTVLLTLVLDRRSAQALGAGSPGVMLVAFAVGLAGFLVHERRAANPVVNLALFRIRMFVFSVLSLLLFATTASVLTFLLPFYLQDVLRLSPSFMGLLFLSAPVLTISLAVLAGHLTDRVGPRIPASIGLAMVMAAFAIGIGLKLDSHWILPALLLACTGVGQGFFNTPNQTAIIGSVPRAYRGFATGLVQMLFGLGSLLGISLGGALLTAMFRHYSGIPDATPSAGAPGPFVAAMSATYAVCSILMLIALAASLLRGGRRVQAAAMD
ncbi:MAG: MFS transporter [Candidatus Rokuibacteriota bacterium]|nr:MAG: MFS transporter [Candidatus Rokubacteria bacterium]